MKPTADQHRTGKQILGIWFRNGLLSLVGAIAALYFFDYAVLRIRMALHANVFDTLSVRPVYAIPHKNGSTEYVAGDPQQQTCVRALFPHSTDPPCWYLRRHTEQRINM